MFDIQHDAMLVALRGNPDNIPGDQFRRRVLALSKQRSVYLQQMDAYTIRSTLKRLRFVIDIYM